MDTCPPPVLNRWRLCGRAVPARAARPRSHIMATWITTREKGPSEKGWDRGRLAGGWRAGGYAGHAPRIGGAANSARWGPSRERCPPPLSALAPSWPPPAANRPNGPRSARPAAPCHPCVPLGPGRAGRGARPPKSGRRPPQNALKRHIGASEAGKCGLVRGTVPGWGGACIFRGAAAGGRKRVRRGMAPQPPFPSAAPSRACRGRPPWPRSPPWPPSARRRALALPPGHSPSSTIKRPTWTWRRARSRSTLTRP